MLIWKLKDNKFLDICSYIYHIQDWSLLTKICMIQLCYCQWIHWEYSSRFHYWHEYIFFLTKLFLCDFFVKQMWWTYSHILFFPCFFLFIYLTWTHYTIKKNERKKAPKHKTGYICYPSSLSSTNYYVTFSLQYSI